MVVPSSSFLFTMSQNQCQCDSRYLLADLPETDPAVNILSLTQVYLDIPCHVTYILDTLQDDLRRYLPKQNCDRSVLGHVD